MSYFIKLLTLITALMIFGCSSTPSTNPKDNLLLAIKKYADNEMAEAKTLLQHACEQHAEAACLNMANMLLDEKNANEALDYLKKACDYGSLRGCVQLGATYIENNQLKEAKTALEKSNHVNLSSEFHMATLLMAEKRVTEAKQIAENLCNKQHLIGCSLRGQIAYTENDLLTAKKFLVLDTESMNSDPILIGIIELQLGHDKAGEKLINESCANYETLSCRIKNLLTIRKNNLSFEKSYTVKCEQSDKDACYNLGLHYFIKRKKDVSTNYFQKACKLGNGYGCFEKINANTFAMQPRLPTNALMEPCEKGASPACLLIYEIYKKGEVVEPIRFLEKSCTLGNILACDKLTNIELKNKNIEKALKRYAESCTLGFQTGCFYLQFTDKNEETQEAVAQKFCSEKNEKACTELADIYNKQDKKILAQSFYEKSCHLKNHQSCTTAIELKSQIDPNFKKFMPHYKLCNKDYSGSCTLAGQFLEEGKQTKGAIELLERGCFLDNSESCDYLGWIYQEEKNESKSKHFYKQGCDLWSNYSCKRI